MMNESTLAQRQYLLHALQDVGQKWVSVGKSLGARFEQFDVEREAHYQRTNFQHWFLQRVYKADPPVSQREFCRALAWAGLNTIEATVCTWREFEARRAATASAPTPMIMEVERLARGEAISADAHKANPLWAFVLRFPTQPRDAQRAQQLAVIAWEEHFGKPDVRGQSVAHLGVLQVLLSQEVVFAEYAPGWKGGAQFLQAIGGVDLGTFLKMLRETNHAALAEPADDVISGRIGSNATNQVNALIAASTITALVNSHIPDRKNVRRGEIARVLVEECCKNEEDVRAFASDKDDVRDLELTPREIRAVLKAFGPGIDRMASS